MPGRRTSVFHQADKACTTRERNEVFGESHEGLSASGRGGGEGPGGGRRLPGELRFFLASKGIGEGGG